MVRNIVPSIVKVTISQIEDIPVVEENSIIGH